MTLAAPITLSPDRFSGPASRFLFWILIVAGLAARLLLAAASIGTNDIDTFERFGRQINEHGIVWLYQQVRTFNHPPLIGYWCAAVVRVADATPLRFDFLFKLPVVAADVLSAGLIFRIWLHRTTETAIPALIAVSAFSWNVASILVTGYHGNTDPIYASLCLLSIYLLESKQRPLLAGIAMAAALNVKLIPLVLLPAILLTFRRPKEAVQFLIGISLAAVPFLPLLLSIPATLKKNVFGYLSIQEYWGFSLALHMLALAGVKGSEVARMLAAWASDGRWIAIGMIALVGLVARRRNWDRFTVCAACWCAFLVFTPGFALQYTAALVPMLCAISILRGFAYGLLAGVMLAIAYAWYVVSWWPIHGQHTGGMPLPSIVAGVIVWLSLAMALALKLRTPCEPTPA